MGRCSHCQRSFFVEKIAKHERVCQGMVRKKYEKSEVAACAVVVLEQLEKAAAAPIKGKSEVSTLVLTIDPDSNSDPTLDPNPDPEHIKGMSEVLEAT